MILIASFACFTVHLIQGTVVNTAQGPVRGVDLTSPYGPVTAFLGIPYAQAPIGELRYEKPQALSPFTVVYNATKTRTSCPQVHGGLDSDINADFGEQSEDCLFLNIWKPKDSRKSDLPVVVYLHGGSFVSGSGSFFMFDGTRLAPRANIVYITINMRLGPFGFLHIPGVVQSNVGLWDVAEALKWIKVNARVFGGNPREITVWGQSAGAIALDFLLKSPLLDGLAKRAVLQGGSSGTGSTLLNSDAEYASRQLAYSLGCFWDDNDDLSKLKASQCLKQLPWQQIVQTITTGSVLEKITIQPSIDEGLIPSDILISNRIDTTIEDILVMTDEDEGFMFMTILFRILYQTNEISSTDWLTSLMVMFKMILKMPYAGTSQIVSKYLPENGIDSDIASDRQEAILQKIISQIFTDSLFFCPANHRAATAASQGVRVYRAEFHFRPGFSYLPPYAAMSHAEEIAYLHSNLELYHPNMKQVSSFMARRFANKTEADRVFSDDMIRMISDFFHGR